MMFSSVLAALSSVFTTAAPTATNVVLIVGDDVGYADLSGYGGTVPTPNIDSIATDGVRFTDAYVVCPMCAPSRAGLMTSVYPQRFGFEFNPDMDNLNTAAIYGLPADRKTLPERLRSVGFTTGMVGKWHLGERTGTTPLDRGFDSFFGFYGGASKYLNRHGLQIWDDGSQLPIFTYLTDEFTTRAVNFINGNAGSGRPFFLYLAYNAIHLPYQAPQTYLDRFPELTGTQQIYAAMTSAMDDGVGAVRQALVQNGIADNTLVIFVSDNGGNTALGPANNAPLREGKGRVYEGGVRVPMAMAWPGHLQSGATFTQPVSAMDIGPTVMDAAGSAIHREKLDGVDLLPFLSGEVLDPPHTNLFWRMGGRRAARHENLKYVNETVAPNVYGSMLYDLSTDISETTDLSVTQRGNFKSLRMLWKNWNSEMLPPLWGPGID